MYKPETLIFDFLSFTSLGPAASYTINALVEAIIDIIHNN